MSLLITLYVPEGIVLAGDSRLTLKWTEKNAQNETVYHSTNGSDTTHKIFNIKNKFGLGTFGAADIKGIPIAGFIDEFIEDKIDGRTEVDEIPQKLQDFFGKKHGHPRVHFYVVGYKIERGVSVQHVYFINIEQKLVQRVNQQEGKITFGANWGGETEILSRLVQSVKIKTGNTWREVKAPPISYNFLTLQDAIDFSTYGIQTTIETLRFQKKAKTVGGPIDVLVVRPNEGVIWVRKKNLS